MKIRLIDDNGKIDQTDLFVTREPKKGEHLCSHDVQDILIVDVCQFAKTVNDNLRENPDFVVTVEYNSGKPVSKMTAKNVQDWFENPESGLLGDDYESL